LGAFLANVAEQVNDWRMPEFVGRRWSGRAVCGRHFKAPRYRRKKAGDKIGSFAAGIGKSLKKLIFSDQPLLN
jgi:hypothetical protein